MIRRPHCLWMLILPEIQIMFECNLIKLLITGDSLCDDVPCVPLSVSGYCSVSWIPVCSEWWVSPPFYNRTVSPGKTVDPSTHFFPPHSTSTTLNISPRVAVPKDQVQGEESGCGRAPFWCVTLQTFIDPQAEEAPQSSGEQLEDTAGTGPSTAQDLPQSPPQSHHNSQPQPQKCFLSSSGKLLADRKKE